MTHKIQKLTAKDLEPLHALRASALLDTPAAFAASPQDDRARHKPALLELLEHHHHAVFGAFAPELCGMAAVYWDASRLKLRHSAGLWGMYVAPQARQRGLGAALLKAAIAYAHGLPGVVRLSLDVTDNAHAALRLYQAHGFQLWGTEPDALCIDGQMLATHHLVLPFPDKHT